MYVFASQFTHCAKVSKGEFYCYPIISVIQTVRNRAAIVHRSPILILVHRHVIRCVLNLHPSYPNAFFKLKL